MDILFWLFSDFVQLCYELFALFYVGFFCGGLFGLFVFGREGFFYLGFLMIELGCRRLLQIRSSLRLRLRTLFLLRRWTPNNRLRHTLRKHSINNILIPTFPYRTSKLTIKWMKYRSSWSFFLIPITNYHRGYNLDQILLQVRLVYIKRYISLVGTYTLDYLEWIYRLIFHGYILILFSCWL